MALIKCPECTKEVSDKAVACPNCAYPISGSQPIPAVQTIESKVIVYGYTQQFLVNPKVSIFLNNVKVGEVGKGGAVEIPLNATSVNFYHLAFKCTRSAEAVVPHGKLTKIKLSWNRITGALDANIVDFASV